MNAETGRITFSVNDESELPPIAAWILANGYTLYEFSPCPVTLEERFVTLMGTNATPG